MIVLSKSGKQTYKGFKAKLTKCMQDVDKNTLKHNSVAGNTKKGLRVTSQNTKKLHNVAKKSLKKHAEHRKHALATFRQEICSTKSQ